MENFSQVGNNMWGYFDDTDGSTQDCGNSITSAMKFPQSYLTACSKDNISLTMYFTDNWVKTWI